MTRPFFKFLKKRQSMDARTIGDWTFRARRNKCEIHRLLINVIDSGGQQEGAYGKDVIMTEGIQVLVKSGDTEKLITEMPIKDNWDWSAYCYDTSRTERSGGQTRFLVRWSFFKSGVPLQLEKGDQFIVRIRDDLTGLDGHTLHVQGNYA